MTDDLGIEYVNVRDYGALGDGVTDDTAAIQRAIDSGRHVLVPRGDIDFFSRDILPYVLGSKDPEASAPVLHFWNDDQRVTFQSGARLVIVRDRGSVEITGKRQTFFGMRIETDEEVVTRNRHAVPDPCLLIDQADGLRLEDLVVNVSSNCRGVVIKDTTGVLVRCGHLRGGWGVTSDIGLVFEGVVQDFVAVRCAIDQHDIGVVVYGTVDGLTIISSTIEANNSYQIYIQAGARIRGLNLLGVHMEPGPDTGAHKLIVVVAGATVEGGYITACEFSAASSPSAVFVLDGGWRGVLVTGCYRYSGMNPTPPASDHAVYRIAPTADVTGSIDACNHWDKIVVLAGDGASRLPSVTSDWDRGLQLSAAGIRIRANRIGFFGAEPETRGAPYTVPIAHARTLTAGNAPRVLATLLADLGKIGLVRCTVDPRAAR